MMAHSHVLFAVTDKVVDVVKAKFAETGISITAEGKLDSKTIDEAMLIDNVSSTMASYNSEMMHCATHAHPTYPVFPSF
jgi:phosphoribosyl-dephospho-CoA transferase